MSDEAMDGKMKFTFDWLEDQASWLGDGADGETAKAAAEYVQELHEARATIATLTAEKRDVMMDLAAEQLLTTTLTGGKIEMSDPTRTFSEELEKLLNMKSMEQGSDTPDFILAEYMLACLNAFNSATNCREAWYGRKTTEPHIHSSRTEVSDE